ncbi:hypothetical protein NKR74_06320 [Bacillus sp. 3103sda1]|uniref:hypothetical protein n=1 Tax=Bacillus sp. 3103sda1 TaxID=2953808 RepID=UPI00209F6411|nr:hypothetical protein [Bacillus sp. 3103sda1]MCP1122951.1 hypothetical protein [Bacillus sp. 3103sda1]
MHEKKRICKKEGEKERKIGINRKKTENLEVFAILFLYLSFFIMNQRGLLKNIHREKEEVYLQKLCRNEAIIQPVISLTFIRANNKKKIGGI